MFRTAKHAEEKRYKEQRVTSLPRSLKLNGKAIEMESFVSFVSFVVQFFVGVHRRSSAATL